MRALARVNSAASRRPDTGASRPSMHLEPGGWAQVWCELVAAFMRPSFANDRGSKSRINESRLAERRPGPSGSSTLARSSRARLAEQVGDLCSDGLRPSLEFAAGARGARHSRPPPAARRADRRRRSASSAACVPSRSPSSSSVVSRSLTILRHSVGSPCSSIIATRERGPCSSIASQRVWLTHGRCSSRICDSVAPRLNLGETAKGQS